MQPGQPSLTALGAARLRAAHQVLDNASIFPDPLALRILKDDVQAIVHAAETHPSGPRIRWFIAARSRLTEQAFAEAAIDGTRQLVVLGAGLDTQAYRMPMVSGLRVFEIDHPATQAWKRQCLLEASIETPEALTFVPVNFERETLADALASAGFDPARRSFFSWLGVVPYLTDEAIRSTLEFIGRLPGGAEVVFDYVNPAASMTPARSTEHARLMARVAAVGETIKNHFDTSELRASLTTLGFRHVDDLGPAEIAARFYPERAKPSSGNGAHIVHAATFTIASAAAPRPASG
jgi:methyltransferase (TIGR00027 family)